MAAGKLDNDDAKYNQEMFEKIGARLKALRKEKGYANYEKFAIENNISRARYGKHERGANINMESLLKILRALDMSLHEFFNEDFM